MSDHAHPPLAADPVTEYYKRNVRLDADTVFRGLNFTLTTSLGDLDLMGEITGGGGYEALKSSADVIELEGFWCLVVSLPKLIDLKRAAGRGKDREALAELEVLLEERERPEP
jgi:hypothetical protein